MTETKPCVMCDAQLESAGSNWDTLQPHGGGEIKMTFAYGSTKFDEAIGRTVFRGIMCDECAVSLVGRMKKTLYGLDGDVLTEEPPQ